MNTSQATRGQVPSSTGQPKSQNTASLASSNVLPRKKSSIFDRGADASRAPLNVQVSRTVEYEKDVRLSSMKTVGTVTSGQQPASTNSNSSSKSSGGLQTPSDPRLQKKPSRAQLLKKKSSQMLRAAAVALGQVPPLPKDAHTIARK
ncbi:hypothetical protein CYLTODRAFT_453719 [Cylindrobasidium torrendii FP15055 ss-10]|uniref:Uncharacterized protein n=1 Tax=Cylindrobasidium torrendii FP15055 ss-10 TaxID=1314674 RepID=A0A0D7BCN7_9AGAR|nr:hypothetical protein CYLTODRAFT_453719 [Cylindrobasidium torrendii FP15055 ss-10]